MAVVVFALVLRVLDISTFTSQVTEKKFDPNEVIIIGDKNIKPSDLNNVAFAEAKEGEKSNVQKVDFAGKSKLGEAFFSDSEIEVLRSLSDRRKELDIRSENIQKRENILKAAEEEVDKKISDLVTLKREIEALLDKQGGMQKERVDSLVKIYEGMKPGQAAEIFNSLEMDILLSVIGNMKERKSSAILALMDPKRAREVTLKLAGAFKLPETPEEVGQ